MTMLRAGGLLDVLTPLSDCRQEPVEKMERKISGVSYMWWISTTRFCVVSFMCPINISLFCVYFVSLLSLLSLFRLSRRGLPRPIYTARAITPLPPLHSYHACLFHGYHAIVLCSIPGLSHLSYHAPPHTLSLIHIWRCRRRLRCRSRWSPYH